MKRILTLLILAMGILLYSGCNGDYEDADIYTSIYPIEFLTKEIVKDRFVVRSIYPRGKDVHDYEPTPKDMIRISNSKIIFYIGLGLEPVIENSKNTTFGHIPLVALSHNLSLVEINSDDHHHDHDHDHDDTRIIYDPHVWLDPSKMITMTDTVLLNIIEHLNVGEDDIEFFTNNANLLKEKLQALDDEYLDYFANNTFIHKTILVDHDAYVYWAVRYGIERIRLRNDNESADVIPAEMVAKIQQAQSLNIKYICTTKNEIESTIINQYLTALSLTKDAKVQLHNIETLTAKEERAGSNYLTLMRENLEVLKLVLPTV